MPRVTDKQTTSTSTTNTAQHLLEWSSNEYYLWYDIGMTSQHITFDYLPADRKDLVCYKYMVCCKDPVCYK